MPQGFSFFFNYSLLRQEKDVLAKGNEVRLRDNPLLSLYNLIFFNSISFQVLVLIDSKIKLFDLLIKLILTYLNCEKIIHIHRFINNMLTVFSSIFLAFMPLKVFFFISTRRQKEVEIRANHFLVISASSFIVYFPVKFVQVDVLVQETHFLAKI